MSRTPVDDCLSVIPNRFELCTIASKRARQLARGATSKLPETGHKSTVQALNEIADGHVNRDVLTEEDLPAIASVTVFETLEDFR